MPETPPPAALPLDEITAARDAYEAAMAEDALSEAAFDAWDDFKQLLWDNRDDLLAEIGRLSAQHEPKPDTYACQRCGRRDGLDAVVPSDVWCRITGAAQARDGGEPVDGRWNLLCLWCIDALCAEHGVTCRASLHFAGKAITGGSQSDADAEHIARLSRENAELRDECLRLRRLSQECETARDRQTAIIDFADDGRSIVVTCPREADEGALSELIRPLMESIFHTAVCLERTRVGDGSEAALTGDAAGE